MLNEEMLTPRLEALRGSGVEPPLVETFGRFVREAPDDALFRANPIGWAKEQRVNEDQAVELFLRAAHAGILELTWGVICPACGAFMRTKAGLRALADDHHCNVCIIDVPPLLEHNVEVAFTVSPRVRGIRFHRVTELDAIADAPTLYFTKSAGHMSALFPVLRDTIILSETLAPGQRLSRRATVPPGRLLVFAPATHTVGRFAAREGSEGLATAAEFEVLEGGQGVCSPAEVAAGEIELTIHNRAAESTLVFMMPDPAPPLDQREGLNPPPVPLQPFLSGVRLITSQAFRDLFRAESVPGEAGLGVKEMTFLFTDLRGSTAMYERIGDFSAYELVRRHFGLLRGIVADRGGAVVKTIGDAIMATFSRPARAVEAAVAMHRGISEIRGQEDLVLKIGVHSGACIAVEQNDRLDYFGSTVNTAARVQGVAAAGEIVCTETTLGLPEVEAVIGDSGLRRERGEVHLHGIEGDVAVVRLSPR